MLFYTYQIDGLNPPSKRTLGWGCKKWDDDDNGGKCRKYEWNSVAVGIESATSTN